MDMDYVGDSWTMLVIVLVLLGHFHETGLYLNMAGSHRDVF